MTRDQLTAMITVLIERAETELRACREYKSADSSLWVANMSASIVLGALADAFIAAKQETPE